MTSPSGEVPVVQNCNALQRPRQNRVSPFGVIEATSHRGTMMGNRGDLHGDDGTLRRQWQTKRWICCTLHSKIEAKVSFDQPGRYYPLFFTDEAVALAAGHRPCAHCRRDDYRSFCDFWARARTMSSQPTADEIDVELHAVRVDRRGARRKFAAPFAWLPSGTFFTTHAAPLRALVRRKSEVWAWSPTGYVIATTPGDEEEVDVLTPYPTVLTMRAGYQPLVAP